LTRLSPLTWNENERFFTQKLFGSKFKDPFLTQPGIDLNDKTLQLLEALFHSPLSPMRQLAKGSHLPLSTYHRIFQQNRENISIQGELSPEKINAITILNLKTGFQKDSVERLEKIILPKNQSQDTISTLIGARNQVWEVDRVSHRFSALTYQLLAKEGYPYPLWGFLFREFLKGQRQAKIFPADPFEDPISKTPLLNPFETPEELVEILKDLRQLKGGPNSSLRRTLAGLKAIQPVLALHISGFTENALITFDLEKEDLFTQTSRALLELPYITLFEARDLKKNRKTLLCWLTCEEGGVFQLRDELSLLGFTDSIRVFID
jgi:hypothetical protein